MAGWRGLVWALGCCMAAGLLKSDTSPKTLQPAADAPPFKYHTVNPEQIAREDRLFKQHADSMKRNYHKLIRGEPDEKPAAAKAKAPVLQDRTGAAKEKAAKAMSAAKALAKEKSKKTLLKTKERLKKRAAKARLKAKERAKKRRHPLTPLKGDAIEKAALARLDAYKTKLKLARTEAEVAKKENSEEQLKLDNETAVEAEQRAQYYEAQAVKGKIKKYKVKKALEREARAARNETRTIEMQANLDMKVSGKKKKPWRCTHRSCKKKCKTKHCLKW